MVLEDCQVVFNNYKGYFYSGDIVTGSVIFGLKHSGVVKGLVLNVKGTSKARWTRPMPTMPHIKVYSEKIEVLRLDISIDTQVNTLVSKSLSIPFHFILPRNIPSSFQDSIAKTHYRVIIKTTKICKIMQKRVFPFIVVAHLNLNHCEYTFYNEKYLYELSKSFGKCKQYQLRIKTYNGIGSNQRAIPFEAYITNEKRIKVSKIVISLLQKLEYTVTSGYYNAEKKIHEFFLKDFKNDLEETCKLLIDIPPVVPSTINLERTLIKISYVYKITVFFRFHFSMTMEIPVVIGSTPVIFTK
ncbi:uncharacterized protein LOC111003520 isoform X2 [Pieris rapae]|uniref:uncharacterized protein LOC111003520 isoform X2 n=1 Tax=Pieris rapae TaxID=64459 RepID=UPI000B928620|nr:uncharacterized protein LOC111003520 isoform X2 [Pieris rapae]